MTPSCALIRREKRESLTKTVRDGGGSPRAARIRAVEARPALSVGFARWTRAVCRSATNSTSVV
jgi:hypothetical protein